MYYKKTVFFAAVAAICLLTSCGIVKTAAEPTDEEKQEAEVEAVSDWINNSLTDEESFTDKLSYQYYARALGLEKDDLLSPDMWEVYYNDGININREIDQKAIYLIRLDPQKLMEIYAVNNDCTVQDICSQLSVTSDQLYYNWGYTMSSVEYENNHANKGITYSDKESSIFGEYNGEDRITVMSTHVLSVDTANQNAITYISDMTDYKILQRDLLHKTTNENKEYNYTNFTDDERSAFYSVNGIGIRAVIPLKIPNANPDANDKEITVMVNRSPFSYGCTDSDKIEITINSDEYTESETETAAETETTDTTAETAVSETSETSAAETNTEGDE